MRENALPRLEHKYEGLRHAPGGEQELQSESIESLAAGFLLAVLGMFVLLAIAFRSSFSRPSCYLRYLSEWWVPWSGTCCSATSSA